MRIPEWIRQDIGLQDLFRTNDGYNNFVDENASGGNDDMTSLIAVIQKLQALVTIGYEKLGSEHKRQRRRRKVVRLLSSTNTSNITEDSTTVSTLEFHLALLAYIQLCNQIKARYPEWRNEMYDRYLPNDQTKTIDYNNLLDELSSIPRDDCSLDTAGTTRTATAASPVTEEQIGALIQFLDFSTTAYETNEELLKSQLHKNGGYQLLLHRTTSSVVDDIEQGNNVGEDETMDNREQQLPTRKKNSRRKPPGRVGYYIAISPSENKLLIGIKGTSTIEELLTDCCGRAVRCDLENNPHYHEIDALDNDCSFGDEQSDNNSFDCVRFSGSDDNDDKAVSLEKITDKDNSCCGEVLDSNLNDLLEAIDRAETSRAVGDDTIDDKAVSPKENTDADNNCCGEVLDSNLNDLLEAIDQAETSRAVCDVYNGPDIDLIGGNGDPNNLSLTSSSSSSSYEYFELRTNDDGHEAVEVELLICNNPKETGSQQHQRSRKRDSHPSENILLLPSRFNEAKQSRNLQRLLQELPTSATVSTIEDNGIEMQRHRSTKLRGAHEGILHSAQQLLQEISPLIEEYAVSKGFDVVCCGHSLGGAAATLLAILIRGKYASLVTPFVSEERGDSDGTRGESQRVRAYAFAPPPLLDRLSSLACRHYVTSVVNNSDIIPRSSLTNLDVLMTVLEAVICALTEASMNPGGSSATNPILASVALFRKLSEGTSGKLLIEPKELKRIQKEAIYEATVGDGGLDEYYWNKDGDHHLLVPGKVLLLYKKWGENKIKELATPPSNGDEALESNAYNAVWTNGTVKMLKGFEVGGEAITDHLTVSYFNALKCCLKDP
eukprot:scaffold12096_cov136-Skeletonema_menzelii.AAC.1